MVAGRICTTAAHNIYEMAQQRTAIGCTNGVAAAHGWSDCSLLITNRPGFDATRAGLIFLRRRFNEPEISFLESLARGSPLNSVLPKLFWRCDLRPYLSRQCDHVIHKRLPTQAATFVADTLTDGVVSLPEDFSERSFFVFYCPLAAAVFCAAAP